MGKTKRKTPIIRFKGFNDDWEQRRLKDVFTYVQSGNRLPKDGLVQGDVPYVLATTDNNGVFMKIDKSTKDYHGNEMKLFDIPSITFSIDNPEAIFIQTMPFYTSNIMRVLHNENINIYHYHFFLEVIRGLTTYFNWSLKFSGPVVHNSKISLPITSFNEINYEEIEKVGELLKSFDNLITLHQRKLDKLGQLKKTMLANMFPKTGEVVPEFRFMGFTDAWEQRKLGDVNDVRDGTHASPKYYEQGHPLVTSKNLKPSGLDISDVSLISDEDYEEINRRSKVDIGDILFGMIGTIGNPIMVKRDDFAIKNVALLKNGGEVKNEFLLQLLKSPVFDNYIRVKNAGGTQKFLGLSQIREFKFFTPDWEEQKKIGTYFEGLENLITLHQRKLESLQELKKTMLKYMFV